MMKPTKNQLLKLDLNDYWEHDYDERGKPFSCIERWFDFEWNGEIIYRACVDVFDDKEIHIGDIICIDGDGNEMEIFNKEAEQAEKLIKEAIIL